GSLMVSLQPRRNSKAALALWLKALLSTLRWRHTTLRGAFASGEVPLSIMRMPGPSLKAHARGCQGGDRPWHSGQTVKIGAVSFELSRERSGARSAASLLSPFAELRSASVQ